MPRVAVALPREVSRATWGQRGGGARLGDSGGWGFCGAVPLPSHCGGPAQAAVQLCRAPPCSSPKHTPPNEGSCCPHGPPRTERAAEKAGSRSHQAVTFSERPRSAPRVGSRGPPEGEDGTVLARGGLKHFLESVALSWRRGGGLCVPGFLLSSVRVLERGCMRGPGVVAGRDAEEHGPTGLEHGGGRVRAFWGTGDSFRGADV